MLDFELGVLGGCPSSEIRGQGGRVSDFDLGKTDLGVQMERTIRTNLPRWNATEPLKGHAWGIFFFWCAQETFS